eukprot:288830-Hanusia_phi.AAC.1
MPKPRGRKEMKEQLLPKDTQQGKDQSTSHEHGDDEAHGGHGHEHGHSHAHSGSISRGFESDEVHCADQDSMVDAPEVALVLNPKRRRDLENDLGSTWKLKMASEKSSRKFLTMLVLSTGYLLAEMVTASHILAAVFTPSSQGVWHPERIACASCRRLSHAH